MASVIRIKRRINEDPAEALRLSCKRQRRQETQSQDYTDDAGAENHSNVSSENSVNNQELKLAFAGTITSKNEPVSHHIRAAIRRTKLHKEMHPHSAELRSGRQQQISSKLREKITESSRSNRYRITSSHRAIDLDLLDKQVSLEDLNQSGNCAPEEATLCEVVQSSVSRSKLSNECDKENGRLAGSHVTTSPKTTSQELLASSNLSDITSDLETKPQNICGPIKPLETNATRLCDKATSVVKEDKMFCIFDVENEEEKDVLQKMKNGQGSTSGITVNGQPMVASNTLRAPLAESEYVYDLYYTHNNLSDLDFEAVLTVQSICDNFVNEAEDNGVDRDLVYDDDDDSNDEDNWRNDYPDEDPHFFENEENDGDCYFAEDMIDTNVLDDGDMLAEWLGSGCKVEADSDEFGDDDEEDYGKENSSDDEFGGM